MPNGYDDNEQTRLFKAEKYTGETTYAEDPYPEDNASPFARPKQNDARSAPPPQNYQSPQSPPLSDYYGSNNGGGFAPGGAGYSRPQQQYSQPRQPQYSQPQQYSQPRQPQQYSQPPQYQAPQYSQPQRGYVPPASRPPKKKSGGGNKLVVLLVILLLLILSLFVGGLIYFLSNKDDSDGSKSKSSSSSVSEEKTRPGSEETTVETEPVNDNLTVVPDVRGSDYISAEQSLKQAGLRCEKVFEFSDNISEDVVIEQSVPAGTEIEKGSDVTITISQGKSSAGMTKVPNVRGYSVSAAKKDLAEANLTAQVIYEENDSVAEDIVIEQSVAPGAEVYTGSIVKLYVSKGAAQTTTKPAGNGAKYGVVNTKETDLNVRKGPSLDADVIGTLAKGSVVEIVGSEGDWYKIEYKSGFGYVSKDYIKLKN